MCSIIPHVLRFFFLHIHLFEDKFCICGSLVLLPTSGVNFMSVEMLQKYSLRKVLTIQYCFYPLFIGLENRREMCRRAQSTEVDD